VNQRNEIISSRPEVFYSAESRPVEVVAYLRVSFLRLTSVTFALWKTCGSADHLLRAKPEKIERSLWRMVRRAITPVLTSAKARIDKPTDAVGNDSLWAAPLRVA
jgi:hypothetical protein